MYKKWIAVAVVCRCTRYYVTTRLKADAPADVKAAVDKSLKAMGAESVKTLTISGDGYRYRRWASPATTRDPYWRQYADKNYVRLDRLHDARWHRRASPHPAAKAIPNNAAELGDHQPRSHGRPEHGHHGHARMNFNNYMEYVFLPEGFLKRLRS